MYLLQLFIFIYLRIFSVNTNTNTNTNTNFCTADDVHALILARGGSKGIPHKNLRQINGVSLLGRTLTVLKTTQFFESIWVSTDSEQIAKEANKFGALVYKRDPIYAQDNTSSLESVQEFLRAHETINKLALFQCTSIFLKHQYINEALQRFETKDCVFAVTRSHKLRWRFAADATTVVPLNFIPERRPRRQDWPGELIEAGMFYLATRQLIMKENRFQNENCGVVEIDAADAMEIDTSADLALAECLLSQREGTKNIDVCANSFKINN